MKSYENVIKYLKALKLTGIMKGLDEILTDAECQKDSYISLLLSLFKAEEITEQKKDLIEI